MVNVANVALPALLEVTFANRKHDEFAETNEVFPTAIDQPNVPSVPEIHLGLLQVLKPRQVYWLVRAIDGEIGTMADAT